MALVGGGAGAPRGAGAAGHRLPASRLRLRRGAHFIEDSVSAVSITRPVFRTRPAIVYQLSDTVEVHPADISSAGAPASPERLPMLRHHGTPKVICRTKQRRELAAGVLCAVPGRINYLCGNLLGRQQRSITHK